MKTRCPLCGKRNDGAFCIICGTPAPIESIQNDVPIKAMVWAWLSVGLALALLSFAFLVLRKHTSSGMTANNPVISPVIVPTANPPPTITPQEEQAAPIQQSQPASTVRRIDPPHEASAAQVAIIFRQAKLVGIFCGDDADPQTCKFLANAVRSALKDQQVNVGLFYQPETLVQSFYIPPMLLPFTDVTLRLIETDTGKGVRADLGGFCFDPQAQDESGFQLPIWSQAEGGNQVGPLEADKAQAASKLARAFADYWVDPVSRSPLEAGVQSAPNHVASTREAAEQGNAAAQDNLGVLYEDGKGVPKDYAQAATWFRKAAEQGNAPAQTNLASLYYLGLGVPRDYAQAYFWISLAASGKVKGVKQEDFDASRDDAASHLTPTELSQVQERVRKWLEEHPQK